VIFENDLNKKEDQKEIKVKFAG